MKAISRRHKRRLNLDIRNARELEGTLIHDRLVHWLETVVWVVLSVTFGHIRARVSRIGPMCRANPAFIRILLSDEVLLSCVAHWHIAGV
jgi:hypothetical protein